MHREKEGEMKGEKETERQREIEREEAQAQKGKTEKYVKEQKQRLGNKTHQTALCQALVLLWLGCGMGRK